MKWIDILENALFRIMHLTKDSVVLLVSFNEGMAILFRILKVHVCFEVVIAVHVLCTFDFWKRWMICKEVKKKQKKPKEYSLQT